jgi:hypothetical protein
LEVILLVIVVGIGAGVAGTMGPKLWNKQPDASSVVAEAMTEADFTELVTVQNLTITRLVDLLSSFRSGSDPTETETSIQAPPFSIPINFPTAPPNAPDSRSSVKRRGLPKGISEAIARDWCVGQAKVFALCAQEPKFDST